MHSPRTLSQKGYRLEVFDIERVRSLLDSSLKEIRRRYLGIDDHLTAQLRSEVTKLLRFPEAVADDPKQARTLLETLLRDQLPRRLFSLCMRYDESVVKEVPSVGAALHEYMTRYYRFQSHVADAEEGLLLKIGTMSICAFAESWRLYLRYALLRFAGPSPQDIMGWGSFLNYGITWVEAERVYIELGRDLTIASRVASLLESHKQLSDDLRSLVTTITARPNQALPADPPPKTAVCS